VRKLERLKIWRVSNLLTRAAYRLTMRAPLARHFALSDQIRRAAISVPANLVEGYGLGTTPQLIRCTRIALASAYELRLELEIARDLALTAEDAVTPVLAMAEESIRMLIGMLKGLGRFVFTVHCSLFTSGFSSRPAP
jgi:four helix bundle protein